MRIVHGRSIKENNAPWSFPRSNNSVAIRVSCSEYERYSVANKIHRAREREKERKREREREREREWNAREYVMFRRVLPVVVFFYTDRENKKIIKVFVSG